jgi:FtsZ-binding cell division protein ZapB
MDNGNEIKITAASGGNRKAEVRLFLKDELLPLQKSRDVNSYNLVNEYAKTKQNKSMFIWGLLGVCFAAVVAITVITVLFLAKQNKKITVDSKVFNDLDLQSMLDSQSHAEMNYLIVDNTHRQLEAERDFELKQAALDRDSNIRLIEALRVENSGKRISDVKANYKKQVISIHEEYDDKIKTVSAAAADYKEKLDALDAANEGKAGFNQQVQQHERTLLVDTYIKTIGDLQKQMTAYQRTEAASNKTAVSELAEKYHSEADALDPVLDDERAAGIVQAAGTMASKSRDISSYIDSFPRSILTKDFMTGMESIQKLSSDYQYIHSFVAGIPQKNSIAGYKTAERRLVNQIGIDVGMALSSQITDMHTAVQNLESENDGLRKERDALIQSRDELQTEYDKLQGEYSGVSGNSSMFNAWFEQKAAKEKAAGYILDVSEPSALKAFVVQTVRSGLFSDEKDIPVVVYHGRLRKVSAGMIQAQNGICYFIPLEPASVSKIAAGDRIVLQAQ